MLAQLIQHLPDPLSRPTVQLKLGTHLATAVFTGKKQQHCQFSNCPKNCSHSGTLLSFKIDQYLHHHASGDKTDAPLKEFTFLANQFSFIDMDIRELKKGDIVELGWLRIGILNYTADTYEEKTDVRILKKIGKQTAAHFPESVEEQNLLDDWGIVVSVSSSNSPTCLVIKEEHLFSPLSFLP